MILIVLIALAIVLGSYVGKNSDAVDEVYLQTIKWGLALSSPLWLGTGLFGILAVFLLYQAFFTAVRNKSAGKDIWFIDEETWLGSIIVKYTGSTGGRVLFFIEILSAILILLV